MSLLLEIAQYLMNAQSCPGDGCPASATTAIAAAWATQGYWVQADILEYLRGESAISVNGSSVSPYIGVRDIGNIPILVYLLGGIAGLVGIALGAPPKNYMWFFIGPAVFSWLIDTTQPVKGVAWMLAHQPQRQEEVWRLSEVGLRNSGIAKRYSANVYASAEPDTAVQVASAFLWLDELVSGVVQSLSWWTGVYDQYEGSSSSDTNLAGGVGGEGKWFLLSNLKWAMVEDITAARLHSADLRDIFAQFMASECGDEIARAIDQPSFIHASKSRGASLRHWEDYTVFLHEPGGSYGDPRPNNAAVARMLANVWIPMPDSMRWLFEKDSDVATGTLREYADFFDASGPTCAFDPNADKVNCATLLWTIVHAFRWEAAHVYQAMMERVPYSLRYGTSTTYPLEFTLFYGWDIKKGRNNSNWLDSGEVLTAEEYQQFLMNLILIHLFRNEMEMVKKPLNIRYASSTEHQDYVEVFQARTGAKAKYGEIYSYAMMVPYIQGILLYFLAIAYPFACMMIVFPGWHKIFITWCTFWIWAKLWDVGFAFVLMIERSLWAMLGNSSDFAGLATFIVKMRDWGATNIQEQCTQTGCVISEITNAAPSGGSLGPCGMQSFDDTLRTFDRALMLSSNLDLDLVNAYYLYFIAALYLAVPAVIGQIVLGAKAGVGGMVGQMFGGTATEGGKAAGEAYKGNFATLGHTNMGSSANAAAAKEMRKSGAMLQALEAGNMGADSQLAQSAAGAANEQLRSIGDALGRKAQSRESAYGVFGAAFNVGTSAVKESGQTLSTYGRTPESGGTGGAAGGPGGTAGPGGARQIGASGGTGTGGGGISAGNRLQRIGQWVASSADFAQSLGSMGVAAAKHASTNANLSDQNNIGAAMADNNLRGFQAGAGAQGFNNHAGRSRSAAEYQGAVAGWAMKRDMAGQLTGLASAIGVFPGSFSPGEKPVNLEGMAMGGMLNAYGANGSTTSDAKGAAQHFNPFSQGGFFSNASAAHSALSASGGGNAVRGAFHATGLTEATLTMPGAAWAGMEGRSMNGVTASQNVPSGGWSNAGHFHQGPEGLRALASSASAMPMFGGMISGAANYTADRLDSQPNPTAVNGVATAGGSAINSAFGKR